MAGEKSANFPRDTDTAITFSEKQPLARGQFWPGMGFDYGAEDKELRRRLVWQLGSRLPGRHALGECRSRGQREVC